MTNLRTYGTAPFRLALIHGGPGAAGEMAPVARRLASVQGVLEPLQTATSLAGQVEELKTALETNAELPAVLVGYSWGAWLAFILAARHPALVGKLILVGSGAFEERYAAGTFATRLSRLTPMDQAEILSLLQTINAPAHAGRDQAFERFGALLAQADAYDPVAAAPEDISFRPDIFHSVWPEASELRQNGQLLQLGALIQCPVIAIHGDYDPHPAEGVREPLSAVLKYFRFILLEKCGHTPWMERQARNIFFEILEKV